MERRKTDAERLVVMRRNERDRRKTRARRLVAMRRIGKDKSKMKYEQRYPRLIIRIKDDLLGLLEKEIDRSQMNASDIARKALIEYLDKREQLEN